MTRPRLGSALLCAAILTLAAAGPALASFCGPIGRISLARYDADGFAQIWTANPDLTAAEQLTAVPGANSIFSTWAPDGSRIAFDSDRSGTGVDVYTMKPDGSDTKKLAGGGFNGEPSSSPDGARIVFESDRGGVPEDEGIYTMRPDGTGVRLIVRATEVNAVIAATPRYSPDGGTIAFTAWNRPRWGKRGTANEFAGATGAVFLVDADGSHPRRLTPWGRNTSQDLDWAPDGKRLVFESEFGRGDGPELYLVRRDGKGLRKLTDNPSLTPKAFAASSDPVWAPDGSRILFTQAQVIDDEFGLDLWTIRPDGTGMAPVAGHTEVWEEQPGWGSAPLK